MTTKDYRRIALGKKKDYLRIVHSPWEQEARYERPNPILRALSLPMFSILRFLPTCVSRFVFLAFSTEKDDNVVVYKNITTFRAMEILYTYRERRQNGEVSRPARFWGEMLDNVRGVRNRLELVREKILELSYYLPPPGKPISILSVGSGSARPVLSALERIPVPVSLMLIDINKEAIEYSKNLAEDLLTGEQVSRISFVNDSFFRVERYCKNFYPDLVEMVGLMDYLNDQQAQALLEKIYRVLPDEGYLITGNILPNLESDFVTKGINWKMIYRTEEQLADLLVKAGFDPNKVSVEHEPLKVHAIAIGRK